MNDFECPDCEGLGFIETICSYCNGSGEGCADGTRCNACHGTGVEIVECDCQLGYNEEDII